MRIDGKILCKMFRGGVLLVDLFASFFTSLSSSRLSGRQHSYIRVSSRDLTRVLILTRGGILAEITVTPSLGRRRV